MPKKINPIIKYLTKSIKYGLRGGATVFIPFVTVPFLSGVWGFVGFSAALQCGFLLKIPLLVVWIQTIIAWIDDGLRWFPNIDW